VVRAYYNDNDPFAAHWLRTLIAAGLIADGDVDQRDVADVTAPDLRGYAQCHFFAGIGGWPRAARLAGLADDAAIWTASLPCQPLSQLGEQRGHVDQRHVWPAFFRLVAVRRPAVVFGEQVASADGREWLAGIRADLEHVGYAVGAADLPAALLGAPHRRQRLYWMGHALGARLEGHAGHGDDGDRSRRLDAPAQRPAAATGASGALDHWRHFHVAHLDDGTRRRIEPGTCPVAHGVPARVGRLRGYGAAVVPQLAALFMRAGLEASS
jgi:DNA (cytosine-5)-methyltransferase 1